MQFLELILTGLNEEWRSSVQYLLPKANLMLWSALALMLALGHYSDQPCVKRFLEAMQRKMSF